MLRDIVKKSRSYRGYSQTERMTREQLCDLVELTRYCPASVNIQPLKYYIASTAEDCAKIQPLTGWARRLQAVMTLPREGHCPTSFIIICQDKKIAPNTKRFIVDVGIVAQTMILRAVEMGFGGIMIGNFDPEKIAAAVGLPEELCPLLLVALGKPDEEVMVTDAENGDVAYTRDENNVTYVPKRPLDEILIK